MTDPILKKPRPFAKERETAISIEILPSLPGVQILIASEETMTFLPAKVWLDTGMQHACMISAEAYKALGSPKIKGNIKSVTVSGQVVSNEYILIDLIFGGMKFLQTPALLNLSLTDTNLLGWAVLRNFDFGFRNAQPELADSAPKTFVFPSALT